MVSLVDIGPAKKKVPLREGLEVEVRGISAMTVFILLESYPDLRKVLTGNALEEGALTALIQNIPHAAAQIIVAAMGNDMTSDAEVGAALALSVGEQALLLKAIGEVTFPQGISSFVEGLGALTAQAGAHGWGQGTRSPAASSVASGLVTTQETPGTTPPDKSQPGENSSSETKSPAT